MNPSKNINITNWFLFILSVVLILGITLIYTELHKQNMIEKSKFVYTIIKDFENNSIDTAIANDINSAKILLKENGGKWSDYDLDQYLGFYELMYDYMDANSLNERDVYDNFSNDIDAAYKNKEIKTYITDLRTQTKDNAYYIKFEILALRFARK